MPAALAPGMRPPGGRPGAARRQKYNVRRSAYSRHPLANRSTPVRRRDLQCDLQMWVQWPRGAALAAEGLSAKHFSGQGRRPVCQPRSFCAKSNSDCNCSPVSFAASSAVMRTLKLNETSADVSTSAGTTVASCEATV